MQITVCDFCGKPVEHGGVVFERNGKRYRIDISFYHNQNGVRAKRTDACAQCTIDFAKIAAQNIIEEVSNSAQQAKYATGQGVDESVPAA